MAVGPITVLAALAFCKDKAPDIAAGATAGMGVGLFSTPNTVSTIPTLKRSITASVVGGGVFGTIASSGTWAGKNETNRSSIISSAFMGFLAGAFVSGGYNGVITGIITKRPMSVIVGANEGSLDCWKKVIHDDSKEPSGGRALESIITDFRIKNVKVLFAFEPYLVLENVWGEKFRINFLPFELPTGHIFAHATRI